MRKKRRPIALQSKKIAVQKKRKRRAGRGNEDASSSGLKIQSLNQELRILRFELQSKNERLTRTAEELQNLFENSEVPLVFTDRELNVRQFTTKLKRLINLIPTDVGAPLGRFFVKLKKEELLGHAAEVLKTLAPKEVEAEDKDGRYYRIRIAPYMSIEGRVGGVVISFTDVHEARVQKKRAIESDKRYQMLFESIDEGFCIIERIEGGVGEPVDFRYIEVNPAFTAQSGMNDVVGKSFRQLLPSASDEFMLIYDSVLKTGEPIRFERGHNLLGRMFDIYAFRVKDESNRRVAVIFNDITQRRRAEQSAALLGAIVNSSADAIISKDLDGVITSWNQGAERIFEYSAQEAIGRPITIIVPHDRLGEEAEIFDRLRRGERMDPLETVRVGKDGSLLNLSVSISPVNDSAGRMIGASTIVRELSRPPARKSGRILRS
jgi:two-component system CheB/CheR fusion protein